MKDVADFIKRKTSLTRYVGMHNFHRAAFASCVMDNTENMTFKEVDKPNQPKFKKDDSNKMGGPEKEILFLDYSMEVAVYRKDTNIANTKEHE